MKTKKRKYTPLSEKLKKEKEEVKRWQNEYWKEYYENDNLRNKLRELEISFGYKIFRIFYQVKANDGSILNKIEIYESHCLDNAIKKLKSNKTYPDSVVLTNIEIIK